ncbi:MAG: outer membrane protein assembly factor BamA [Arenicellales bacterium]|nr:outer membrane protein assembly factor BamA [Arenicellales bacterium]
MTRYAAVVCLLIISVCAAALEPFIVSDIRVEGLQKISPGTVFNYLPVKVGDQVDDEIAKESIRALFKTGFFQDVELEQEGTVLIVKVLERPSIADIEVAGNREIKDEAIETALQTIGLVEGRVFDRKVLDQVVQELKKQYFATGKYGAEVKEIITPLERNRVSIRLEITEGDTAKIKQINIVGNERFDEDELRDEFDLSTPALFTFFTRKDRYSRQQLQADLESLRSFYQDRGYLDFRIESTQVSISPDKKDIFVTINISEGEQYTVTDFRIEGRLILPEELLFGAVFIEPNSTYSRRDVAASEKAIADLLANEGYAFAQVNAVPEINEEDRTVSFTIFVDPGRRVYVRRINISGNTVTRDEVIRRELRQLEGGWYSAKKVQRSRVRLQRLGFFEDIKIDTPAVPGSPDQVDVNIEVTERATGSVLFGVGWSDADGILFQAAITQKNLFGTGKELDLTFDNSNVTDIIRLSYVNPYHTIDGVSRGFNLFRRTVDATRADTADYITETTGGGIVYRFPLSELDTFSLGANLERVDLESTSETPPGIREFIEQNPSNDLLTVLGFVTRDTRDSTLFPTRGNLNRLNYEVAVPPSDLEFYKLNLRSTWYWPITQNLTYKIGGELGYGDGFGDTEVLPFFRNFFAGGATSVRGYKARSLGPKSLGDDPQPIGGDRRILFNTELLFPLPGVTGNDKRFVLFVDGGQVYGPGQDIDLNELRFSAGIGFNWYSPVGPLSVSIAEPLNDKPGDDTERIQFTLGRFFN